MRLFADFALELADAGGDEFHFEGGVRVEPLIDLCVEEAEGVVTEFAVKGLDVAGTLAGGSRCAFPDVFAAFAKAELLLEGLNFGWRRLGGEAADGLDGGGEAAAGVDRQ
jgi:hypothetical protein